MIKVTYGLFAEDAKKEVSRIMKEEKLEMAKNALKKGFSIEVIEDITGLTLEEYLDAEINRGENEGKAEGKAEEKIDIAKRALEQGATVEFISDITDLPIWEIKKLQDELNNQ